MRKNVIEEERKQNLEGEKKEVRGGKEIGKQRQKEKSRKKEGGRKKWK